MLRRKPQFYISGIVEMFIHKRFLPPRAMTYNSLDPPPG